MRSTRAGVLATSRLRGCPISSADTLMMVDSPPLSQLTPDVGTHRETTMPPRTRQVYLLAGMTGLAP